MCNAEKTFHQNVVTVTSGNLMIFQNKHIQYLLVYLSGISLYKVTV